MIPWFELSCIIIAPFYNKTKAEHVSHDASSDRRAEGTSNRVLAGLVFTVCEMYCLSTLEQSSLKFVRFNVCFALVEAALAILFALHIH